MLRRLPLARDVQTLALTLAIKAQRTLRNQRVVRHWKVKNL
jgi:hypothetical protein